jgi:hypothetical protein
VRASTGIEPLFRLSDNAPGHQRAGVVAALKAAGRTDVLGFVDTHGRLPADPTLPQRLVAVLATATQISPAGHLAMAAAVKACVDEAGVQDGEPAELGAVDRGVRHLCQLRAGSGYARGGNQSCPTTLWDGTPESREPVTVARQTYGQVLEQVRGQVAGLPALV